MGFGKAFDKVQEVIMFSLIFSFLSYSVSLYINQCVYVLSFDELLELSHQGNNRVVDMLVGDIYGGTDYAKIGLSATTIASNFGKAAYRGTFRKKIIVEKGQFLPGRLKIVVFPTLALIKNAKVDDYVVGFDELGGTDEFSTEDLEERLAKAQVIFSEGDSSLHASKSGTQTKRSVRQSSNADSSDSD